MLLTITAGLMAMVMQQVVRPVDTPTAPPNRTLGSTQPRPVIGTPPETSQSRTGRVIQNGLRPADYVYTMPAGVTTKEIVFYSEGVACYGKIFYPKDFNPNAKPGIPAVVLGQGYAGTHFSIEKYAARFAERGLVAMVIDYRGWGYSDGEVLQMRSTVGGTFQRDETRFSETNMPVRVKRTRMTPPGQQQDYRNAISFIQGEPGVNPERIGVWGSSQAGGNAVAVAGRDARVKVVSVQIPGIAGREYTTAPVLRGAALEDAVKRAREGQGRENVSGFSRYFAMDAYELEQNPVLFWAAKIGARPLQVIVADEDELINNDTAGRAAIDLATGPKEYIVVPRTSHFEIYTGPGFEQSANASAAWFVKYLNAPEAADPPAPAGGGRGGPPGAAPAAAGRGGAPAAAGGRGQ